VKRLIPVGALIFCGLVSSQTLDFKGFAFGTPIPAMLKAMPGAQLLNCATSTKNGNCMLIGVTYANVYPKSMYVRIRAGGLDEVMMVIEPSEFDQIASAVAERHGKPTWSAPSTLQNGFGAKFDQLEVAWKIKDGSVISGGRYSYSTDSGYFVLSSPARAQETEEAAAKRQPPKKDI